VQKPDGGQEVELEVDAGPEVNSMQKLEVNGRQEVEVDGGQEVNRRQRVVGDEYAMGGIRLQTLLPPPELPATSRASYYLYSLQSRPQLTAVSRASCCVASGTFDRLQSL
jgi:hypothetical protein